MKMKDILKTYWFVGIIAVLLVVFIGAYEIDAIKTAETKVQAKQIDGQYVVYSVDGQNKFADEFYDSLYKENGANCALMAYQRAILNKTYETTSEMKTIAGTWAANAYQYYGEAFLNDQLVAMGYTNGIDDAVDYYIDAQKQDLLIKDYLKEHFDEYVPAYQEQYNGRIIYHILVKVADVTTSTDEDGNTIYTPNPTEEEAKKLQDVLKALETEDFKQVAFDYSDDGSASTYGYIGFISENNKAQYYVPFANKSMELKENEVSDVVNSTAGYHIILNDGTDKDVLLEDANFLSEIENTNPTISVKAITAKAEELGYEIVDEDLKALVDAQLNQGGQQ